MELKSKSDLPTAISYYKRNSEYLVQQAPCQYILLHRPLAVSFQSHPVHEKLLKKKKIIQEENLEIQTLTLHEMGSLLVENFKMG